MHIFWKYVFLVACQLAQIIPKFRRSSYPERAALCTFFGGGVFPGRLPIGMPPFHSLKGGNARQFFVGCLPTGMLDFKAPKVLWTGSNSGVVLTLKGQHCAHFVSDVFF